MRHLAVAFLFVAAVTQVDAQDPSGTPRERS